MIRLRNRGQSVLEFSIMLIIVIGAFIAMQFYVKRGIQGRWKTTIDDFGEQYDPRLTNANMLYQMHATSSTQIQTIKANAGNYWTMRTDSSNSTTTTSGLTSVGD